MNHAAGSFDNPFATRWVAPGALPYLFPSGRSAVSLLERFHEHRCRGSIVGPHGCGKSTLLATLLPHLREEAADVEMVVLRARERKLPESVSDIWRNAGGSSKRRFRSPKTPTPNPSSAAADLRPEGGGGESGIGARKRVLVVDGWEQLRPWTRLRIDRRCRRAGCGLLVTCHRPLRLPVLTRLSPDPAIARKIVARLTQEWDVEVPADVIDASFQSHRGNCRELLFDLYDWYERSNRKHRSKRKG